MTEPMPHIHRRRRALGRLQMMTTGAAIAGVAGTAGFAAVAAVTWAGRSGVTSAADVGVGSNAPGEAGNAANDPFAPQPVPSENAQPGQVFGAPTSGSGSSGATRVRPPQPTTGRSHATSGGSG